MQNCCYHFHFIDSNCSLNFKCDFLRSRIFKGDLFGAKVFHRMACSIDIKVSAFVSLVVMNVLNRRFFKVFIMVAVAMKAVSFSALFLYEIRYKDSLWLKHLSPVVECVVKIPAHYLSWF